MIAQVFPSLRILDRPRSAARLSAPPRFWEPPGTESESLALGFETYDAFLAARYEAEGFLVNTTDADIAAQAVQRIRRDPSQCLKSVFPAPRGSRRSGAIVDEAESLLAEFRRHAGLVAELPPATESTLLLRYLSVRPGKVLKPHSVWRDPQIYS